MYIYICTNTHTSIKIHACTHVHGLMKKTQIQITQVFPALSLCMKFGRIWYTKQCSECITDPQTETNSWFHVNKSQLFWFPNSVLVTFARLLPPPLISRQCCFTLQSFDYSIFWLDFLCFVRAMQLIIVSLASLCWYIYTRAAFMASAARYGLLLRVCMYALYMRVHMYMYIFMHNSVFEYMRKTCMHTCFFVHAHCMYMYLYIYMDINAHTCLSRLRACDVNMRTICVCIICVQYVCVHHMRTICVCIICVQYACVHHMRTICVCVHHMHTICVCITYVCMHSYNPSSFMH